jgi:hypothetical protein
MALDSKSVYARALRPKVAGSFTIDSAKKGGFMKKIIGTLMLALFLLGMTAATVGTASAQGPVAREAGEHPNIARAIDALQDAIADLQAAPHDFGGHKAQAIQASEKAIRQLKMALAYRAHEDRMHRP